MGSLRPAVIRLFQIADHNLQIHGPLRSAYLSQLTTYFTQVHLGRFL